MTCLCGKEHPCPDHGRFVGQEHVSGGRPAVELCGFLILAAMNKADRYGHVHTKSEGNVA